MQAVDIKLGWKAILGGLTLLFLASCTTSQNDISGPVQVGLIQATSGRCQFAVRPVNINTLTGLSPLRGKLGTVVKSDDVFDYDSKPEMFEKGTGLFSMDTFFTKSGGKIYPLDYPSLAAISIYGFLDQVNTLFSSFDSEVNLTTMITNSADSKLVYQAKRYSGTEKKELETDNASYYYIPVDDGVAQNYLMVYPAGEASVPLGLNPFVVAHESGHFVSRHLWRKYLSITAQSALNVVGSLDEGFADYVGFMITKDPGGFLCSFPNESSRNLETDKTLASFRAKVSEKSQSYFDVSSDKFLIHYGGAIFANIQYKIGNIMGHDENFRALIRAFKSLKSGGCGGSNVSFSSFGSCHQSQITNPTARAQASTLYSQGYTGAN